MDTLKGFTQYSQSSKTALIIIDMINEFCSPGGWADQNGLDYSYCEKCIQPIQSAITKARKANIPIFWVNWGIKDINSLPKNQFYLWKKKPSDVGLEAKLFRSGSQGVQIIPSLKRNPQDTLIEKERIGGFFETELHSKLQNLGIQKLLLAGVNTDQCVLETMVQGNFLGYECHLLYDCCATNSPTFCEKAALYNAKECYGHVSNSSTVF